MEKQIKVIKIIDDKTLVINAGRENGIETGNDIEIYQPGNEIIDPDTNKSLGTLDYIKAELEVVNVYPKMSVCKDVRTKTYPFASVLNLTQTYTETLNINPEDISGGFEDVDKKIRIGDLARNVSK